MLLLVTGATGLVGSHVAEQARLRGWQVRALVRDRPSAQWLAELGIELVTGSLTEPSTLPAAVAGVTHVVHCAAKVGDWGPVSQYREVNVVGVRHLLDALQQSSAALARFVHISSLGVYQARDHHGTDETEPLNKTGIDGYTLTKVESEELLMERIRSQQLPAVILRPGFIYGPRDRTVLPKLLLRLQNRQFKFLGSGEQLLNNIYVGNLVEAVFAALDRDGVIGEALNLTDGQLVSRLQFIGTICQLAGYDIPSGHVPLAIAKPLATGMEWVWRLRGKSEAPLLSQARIKFLGLNLDYSIDKARRLLSYEPVIDFQTGMRQTMDWAIAEGLVRRPLASQ